MVYKQAPIPIVIFESTVYPGVTEDYCIPLIEQNSGLEANKDFFYGYSPERINPGDQIRTINNITKLTSGSDIHSAKWIDKFYSSLVYTSCKTAHIPSYASTNTY